MPQNLRAEADVARHRSAIQQVTQACRDATLRCHAIAREWL